MSTPLPNISATSEPIPTPYDIIDPSPGAVIPTGIAWVILLLVAVLLSALITWVRRTPRAYSLHATIRGLLDELRALSGSSGKREELERISRLARRIVAPYCSADTGAMSCSELRALAASLASSQQESDRSLSQLLDLIAGVEERAYAPLAEPSTPNRDLGAIETLISSLEVHIRRFRLV